MFHLCTYRNTHTSLKQVPTFRTQGVVVVVVNYSLQWNHH